MDKRLLLLSFLFLFFTSLSFAQLSLEFEITEPSCGGFTDGSIVATVSGGMQPYEVLWSTGHDGLGLLGIGAGSYSITVTDADGLSIEETVELEEPVSVVGAVNFTGSVCENPGDITASGSGGTAPYTFMWGDGPTEAERTGLVPGLYCVTVTDANGCADNACLIVPEPITLDFIENPPTCSFGTDGQIVVIAQGGTAPYSYEWNNGATNSSNNNLIPGTFHVTVTDADGCTAIGSGEVPNSDYDLSVSIDAVNPDCPNTGSVTANVTGGQPPYLYQWLGGQSSSTVEGLMGNMTFAVTVFDNNGCTDVDQVFLEMGSDLSISVTSNYDCGDTFGTATVAASGGLPPYDYEWTNGDTGPMADELLPGQIYSVSVTDGEGCTISKLFAVADTDEFDVDVLFDFIQPLCFGYCDASATAIVPGMDPADLNYVWSTGQTSQTIINLPSGTFTVTVYDDNGCGGVGSVVIPDPPLLAVDLDITDFECGMPGSGMAVADITGGTPPYNINWSTGDTDNIASGLDPGSYTLIVTDANGCEVIETFSIGQDELEVMVNGTNASCNEENGMASVTVVGGTPPYDYEWSNGETTGAIGNLAAGTYNVTVTDASGCIGTGSVSISSVGGPDCSASVVMEISAPGANDGSVTATGSGGTPPYTFEWSNGQSGATISNLGSGEYTVTVTDANDCESVCEVSLEDGPCVPLSDPGVIGYDQTICGPGVDPDPIVNVELPSGGVGTIEYLWMRSAVGGDFNNGYWEIIPGADGPSYDPGPVYETTFFARCARIVDCGSFIEPEPVIVEVLDDAVAEIIPPEMVICEGVDYVFSATDNGPGASYYWNFGPGATPLTSTEISPSVSWSSFGNRTVTLIVTQNGCESMDVLNVSVTTGPICGLNLVIDANPNGPNSVMVNWEMALEAGDFDYVVERSPDAEHFDAIGSVTSEYDHTGNMNYYQFEDLQPKMGRAYYRVKFLTEENEILYSNIDDVVRVPVGESAVYVYPNPFRYGFLVEILDESNLEPVTLDIRSASGKGVLLENMDPQQVMKEVDMANFPSGVYFMRVKFGDNEMKTVRMVKLYD